MIYYNNPILQGASGKLDNTIYYVVGDQVRSRKNPGPRKKPATAAQCANEARFAIAAAGAKSVLENPEMKAYYKALGEPLGKSAYAMALKVCLNELKAKAV